MGPDVQGTVEVEGAVNGAGAPLSEAAAIARLAGEKAVQARSLLPVRSVAPTAESRLNERLIRVLEQRRGPDAVLVRVLCAAMLLGLIGLAAHFFWIVAIIVMAVGLGYTMANSRRDRIDLINQRADLYPGSAPDPPRDQ